jgi:colanic acid/amylovoran biosynthesis glycosyltransferase
MGRHATLGLVLTFERLFEGASKTLARQMQSDKVNVIHAHFGRAGYHAVPIARRADLPLITSFYGYDVSQYGQISKWRKNYLKLFSAGDMFLCLGPDMQKNLIRLGCPEDKTRIHHLGVDVSHIEYRPRHWDGSEPLKVLIAAAFRPKKGIPYALDALGQIRTKQPIQITIIGDTLDTPDSMPEKQKILEMIRLKKLDDCTTLLGFKPYKELIQQSYDHHIFLAPSITADDGDMEGTPMSLVDMAATGIPIVSSRHADIPEIIIDGKTGLLANERNVEEIVAHFRWLIENQNQWESMTRAGRLHIESEFDLEVQAERLSELYDIASNAKN